MVRSSSLNRDLTRIRAGIEVGTVEYALLRVLYPISPSAWVSPTEAAGG